MQNTGMSDWNIYSQLHVRDSCTRDTMKNIVSDRCDNGEEKNKHDNSEKNKDVNV